MGRVKIVQMLKKSIRLIMKCKRKNVSSIERTEQYGLGTLSTSC